MDKFTDYTSLSSTLGHEIIEITLSKCYIMPLREVVAKVASPQLQKLDLTEALLLQAVDVEMIADRAVHLTELNLSWCGGVSN